MRAVGACFGLWETPGQSHKSARINYFIDLISGVCFSEKKRRPVSVKKEISGYWMFMGNPNKWAIDRFILSGVIEDTYSISDYHKDHFQQGQLGIIRVGKDT